ncbi:protein Son-like [Sabethes cyaneus]|uniref:protein Son-like n=1 Tax=Sabethes cyaneus TaxID=53552 RepID=UPI00237D5594|nr:protein Son-like [Sabethes cyaneus]
MYPAYGSNSQRDNFSSSQTKYNTSGSSYVTEPTNYSNYVGNSSDNYSYYQPSRDAGASSSQTNYNYERNMADYTLEYNSPAYSTNNTYGNKCSDNSQYNPSYTNALYSAVEANMQESSAHKERNMKQHWVRRDFHRQAAPYAGEKGSNLLQKMGWCPGEGLGKRKDGSLEPHLPFIKMNKRGFDIDKTIEKPKTFRMAQKPGFGFRTKPVVKKLVTEGKHPISILGEYCSKQKWEPPIYRAVVDEGPVHAKNFVFKVIVNGNEYEATTGSNIKKNAKAEAANVCLRKFNILKD